MGAINTNGEMLWTYLRGLYRRIKKYWERASKNGILLNKGRENIKLVSAKYTSRQIIQYSPSRKLCIKNGRYAYISEPTQARKK